MEEFLIEKHGEVSFHQYITLKQRGRRFAKYCEAHGAEFVHKITTEHCIDWLDSTKVTRARNNYLGDIGNFLNWCTKHPRKWLPLNPAETVARKRKRYGKPVILTALHADRIMYEVEQNFTRYACFYAIALLAGVRQDKQDGELKRLAKAVQAQGWAPFIRGDLLRIPKPKVGPERDFPLPDNLKEWIRTYRVLEVPSAYMHRKLIKRLKIPDNSMRHTGISAHVCNGGSIGLAASIFGTSEDMIKRHYLSAMSAEECQRFYAIKPRGIRGVIVHERVA
jgi:integrase